MTRRFSLGRSASLDLLFDLYSLGFGIAFCYFKASQSSMLSISLAFLHVDVTFGGRIK